MNCRRCGMLVLVDKPTSYNYWQPPQPSIIVFTQIPPSEAVSLCYAAALLIVKQKRKNAHVNVPRNLKKTKKNT